MDNITLGSAIGNETSPHVYSAEAITLMLGGLGGMIASLIYALKNVNHLKSGCCECDQKVSSPRWSSWANSKPPKESNYEQPQIAAVSNV